MAFAIGRLRKFSQTVATLPETDTGDGGWRKMEGDGKDVGVDGDTVDAEAHAVLADLRPCTVKSLDPGCR